MMVLAKNSKAHKGQGSFTTIVQILPKSVSQSMSHTRLGAEIRDTLDHSARAHEDSFSWGLKFNMGYQSVKANIKFASNIMP